MGPGVYFIHSAALPRVYMSLALDKCDIPVVQSIVYTLPTNITPFEVLRMKVIWYIQANHRLCYGNYMVHTYIVLGMTYLFTCKVKVN